jgi:hypothetical protein
MQKFVPLPSILRRAVVAHRQTSRAISSSLKRSNIEKTVIADHAVPQELKPTQPRRKPATKDLFSLDGRTVVVTGAGRGLGITLAAAILDAGGDVACLDVLPRPSEIEWSGITKVANETGRKATYYQCDITSERDVEATLSNVAGQALDRAMPIRGLISCAGIQQMTDAIDYPIDGFRKILEVNVTGSFLVAKHTARIMKDGKDGGSIVFIASMSGQIANRVSHFLSLFFISDSVI